MKPTNATAKTIQAQTAVGKKTLSSLEKLKSQQAKLAARIQAAEARVKVSERKQDTRRKILIGAYYLDEARKNHGGNGHDGLVALKAKLDGYLKRDSDRKLFDLSPLPVPSSVKE